MILYRLFRLFYVVAGIASVLAIARGDVDYATFFAVMAILLKD